MLTKSVITPLNKKQLGQSSQIKVLINLKQNLLLLVKPVNYRGKITFNFNNEANKINDIRITDTNSTSFNFSFIAKLDPNNFTVPSTLTYFKAFFGAETENYIFLPDKNEDTFIISVIPNEMLANGGSGTVGLSI